MKTLFIDTHLNDIHIILFEDNNIFKEEHILNKKQNSTFLMPAIKKVCEDENIDEIIVVNGPGSFTGVRLGVTIAKTLAYTLDIPIKVISYLKMMMLSSDSNYVAFNDGNGFYIGDFSNEKEKYLYLKNNEFESFNKKELIKTDVTIDYNKVLEYMKSIKSINPHEVNPIYIKLIGVENDKKS